MINWKSSGSLSLVIAVLTLFLTPDAACSQSTAHLHISHIADSWDDTPGNVGLLVAAQAEATRAAFHAALAVRSDDVDEMREHMSRVLYAIDPRLGDVTQHGTYGLLAAASAAAEHAAMVASSEDASEVLRTHAEHVRTSLQNVVIWAESVVEMARSLGVESDMRTAAPVVDDIATVTETILSGVDGNGNGRISWGVAEGGIDQAVLHLHRSKRDEGMASAAACDEWNTEAFMATATLEEVVACLQSGSDPIDTDDDGYAPLHHAARGNENPLVVFALIQQGAEAEPTGPFNSFDYWSETPLLLAVEHNGNLRVVETLLAAGADPNAQRSNTRHTPLTRAISLPEVGVEDRLAMIDLLLDAGGDPLKMVMDVSALALATYGNILPGSEVYKRLHALAGLSVGCVGWYDGRWFRTATAERVAECIRGGALVNYPVNYPGDVFARRRDILHLAVRETNDRAVIRALLDAGATGISDALCVAASHTTNPDIIRELMSFGGDAVAHCSDPMSQDPDPTAALLEAIDSNRSGEVLKAFLESGVDPVADVHHGYVGYSGGPTTVAHFAARSENIAAMEALLDLGVDPFSKDRHGRTVLDYALENEAFSGSGILRRMNDMIREPG